jgi:succinate dehydrogenase / fumarate reductase flavoprotein subunit
VAAWDYSEEENPKLYKEELKYKNVKLKTRSYK